MVAKIARIALLVCLLLGGAAGAESADDEVFPSDPRIIEANSLLDQKDEWDRAIALYREVLAEDPGHVQARLWLARVLSWQGQYDEALAEFRTLAGLADPPDGVWVERAEVLSWAGRYDEAEAAFQAILAEDPENARAAAGLARVYLWSGREQEADRAYERALALGPDDDLRRERAELRSRMGRQGKSDSSFYSDSDDFSLARVGADATMDLDLATRLLLGTAFTRAHAADRIDDPTLPGFGMPDTDRSIDGLLGLERRFGRGWKGRVQAGGRWWDRASSRVLARGGLEYTWSDTTVLGLRGEWSDALERTQSLDAVQAGIDAGTVRGWFWKGLTESIESYGYAEDSFLSDGNNRVAAGLSGSWQPDPDFEFRISLFGDVLSFAGEDPLYYSPKLDVGGGLGFSGSLPVRATLAAEYDFQVGGGYTEELGLGSAGLVYRLQGGFAWQPAGWLVRLAGNYARSQRVTAYRSTGASLTIGRSF